MSLVENIDIYSPRDILELESKDLRRCGLRGPKDRNVKLTIAKLDVPEMVNYEISNLTVENETLEKLGTKSSISLSNCKLQNIEGLKFLMERKYRELTSVTLAEENLIINTSDAIESDYKIDIDCTKVKEITQELLDSFATLSREKEELTLSFSIEQLREIREKALRIDSKCSTNVIIENASELSAEETTSFMKQANLKYVKITPKENENSAYSHHRYEAIEYQKSREILDKVLEGLDRNDLDKAKLLAEIYKRLAFHMKYDHDAVDDPVLKEERKVISRNLVGGLVEGKCVCAGYAEILRNACALCGIETRYVSSKENLTIDENGKIDSSTHAFVQVKMDGIWYNADLTWDRDNIVSGKLPEYFLKRDTDFIKMGKPDKDGKYSVIRTHIPREGQNFDKCKESYPEDKIAEYFSEEKQPTYLVLSQVDRKFESPELNIKRALEQDEIAINQVDGKVIGKQPVPEPTPEPKPFKIAMTTNPEKTTSENSLEHKFYQTDLVDEQAVLYPDGKNGESIGIQVLDRNDLTETETVTREILQYRTGERKNAFKNAFRKIDKGTSAIILAMLGTELATNGPLSIMDDVSQSLEIIQNAIKNSGELGASLLPMLEVYGNLVAGPVIVGGVTASMISAVESLQSQIYNSPEARKIRNKLGISPNPRKLRTNISKSSSRIIKTFATKKANPRTSIKYISEKNDELIYSILGEHLPYNPEMDSAIEQGLIENELQLRSVELCDGISYKNGTLEESLYEGDVFVAKYWRTKNHPNPTTVHEVEDYETHKTQNDVINRTDEKEREVFAYYKRDVHGKLYMFGMGDKDTTVFYDLEEPLAVESSKVRKGVQKEITLAEEIMGYEIQTRMEWQMLSEKRKVYTNEETGEYSSTARAWMEEETVRGKIKDIIKIDGQILGYPETASQKSRDGMKRDKDTAFFLVSVVNEFGKESYYFVDSNYRYSDVQLRYNSVFGNSKAQTNENDEILVNVSTDETKPVFETRKILAEFESTGFDEKGNPNGKKKIAVTRNENGRLQVIEPYGEEKGKRYAALLPQTICMDSRIREKYASRHNGETKQSEGFKFNAEKYSKPEFRAAAIVSKLKDAYNDYVISPQDIQRQRSGVLLLAGDVSNIIINGEQGKDTKGKDDYGEY